VNRISAVLFFLLFVLIVVLFLMNVFIGIICTHYVNVKNECDVSFSEEVPDQNNDPALFPPFLLCSPDLLLTYKCLVLCLVLKVDRLIHMIKKRLASGPRFAGTVGELPPMYIKEEGPQTMTLRAVYKGKGI